jgi:hypothetical protein
MGVLIFIEAKKSARLESSKAIFFMMSLLMASGCSSLSVYGLVARLRRIEESELGMY